MAQTYLLYTLTGLERPETPHEVKPSPTSESSETFEETLKKTLDHALGKPEVPGCNVSVLFIAL